MVIVLLGSLPSNAWLRGRVLRSPRFLGNRLIRAGVKPDAMISFPWPRHTMLSVLRSWWVQERWHSFIHLRNRLLDHRLAIRLPGGPVEDAGAVDFVSAEVPVIMTPCLNSDACAEALNRFEPGLIVYSGGREIVPRRVLEIPRLGVLGMHWGRLPQYRGMNMTEWALLNCEPPVVSVLFLEVGVDLGDIVLQRPLSMQPGDTIDSLRVRSSELGVELLVQAVQAIVRGEAIRTPQRPEDGKQYFVMDERLKRVAERNILALCRYSNATA